MTTKREPGVGEHAMPHSSLVRRIDGLSESDRRMAEEAIHNGELMADLIRRAGTSLKSAVALVSKSLPPRAK